MYTIFKSNSLLTTVKLCRIVLVCKKFSTNPYIYPQIPKFDTWYIAGKTYYHTVITKD